METNGHQQKMNEENVVYTYNVILFRHRTYGNPIICDHVNGLERHYAR